MWVRMAGPPVRRLILFDHDASRAATVAERLLKAAHGYVQSDGYAAYDGVSAQLSLAHVGCFAVPDAASLRRPRRCGNPSASARR